MSHQQLPFSLIVTGVKFIVVADSKQHKVDELLRNIYELYADYVLKNPFYSLDMPIRYVSLHHALFIVWEERESLHVPLNTIDQCMPTYTKV